jgi:hypothetical protein
MPIPLSHDPRPLVPEVVPVHWLGRVFGELPWFSRHGRVGRCRTRPSSFVCGPLGPGLL